MKSSCNNPFISCTARDMSYSDVEKYWCQPFDCYNIDELTLNTSYTPVIIEGARGSGKTMILKHQSFFCRKEAYQQGNYLRSVKNEGFLGIYYRYVADYGTLFKAICCPKEYKDQLFSNYFHLSITLEFGKFLKEIEDELSSDESQLLFVRLSELCKEPINSAANLISWSDKSIKKLDSIIRSLQYNVSQLTDLPQFPTLAFYIVSILRETVVALQNVLFIIIIDEYENVGSFQQIINTYIKQLDGIGGYTFRIGVRPEGIESYRTNIGEEFLQEGRDFLLTRLEVPSSDKSARYRKFVEDVVNRRLNMVPIFSQANITIDQLLGREEDYAREAKYHTKRKALKISDFIGRNVDEAYVREIIKDEDPLVEAYYAMRLKRGVSIDDINRTKEDLREGKETSQTKKYYLDMQGKYKAALLFWIIDKCRAKKLYYSLSTYIYLSCGSIYDFIGLCRTLFDELESDYFDFFDICPLIPWEKQDIAARKYARSQIEKIKINHDYGLQMWYFANNMCSLFSYYHKGDLCITYPETNQFYIKGSFVNSGINKAIWNSLIKWGIVVKKSTYQRASVSDNSKIQLYYINKIYYPVYDISCRIRGGYNLALTDEMWNDMIVSTTDPAILAQSGRKKPMSHGKNAPYEQTTMW